MSNKLIDLSALGEYKTQSDLKYQDKLTAGDSITINNNVISVTPEFGATASIITGSQSVPNNTLFELGNVTLMPGTYILAFTCLFDSNSGGGYRQCGFSTNNTDLTGFGRAWGDFRYPVNGEKTQTCVSGTFQVLANDYPNGRKFYFLAQQNSGSALNASPRCYYFKF